MFPFDDVIMYILGSSTSWLLPILSVASVDKFDISAISFIGL